MVILSLGFFLMLSGLSVGQTASEDEVLAAAVGAYRDNLYAAAESHILAFLGRFPQSPHRMEMLYLLGRTYFLENKFLKARDTFLRLINDDKVDPVDQTNGLFWLAESCGQLDRWEEAKAYYTEFLGKAPAGDAQEKTLFALGLICLREKALIEAEAYFSRALASYPNSSYAAQEKLYRGLIYAQWKNYHRAVHLLRESLSAPAGLPDPLRTEAVFALAENRLRLGQFQLALPYYLDFYQAYPQDPRAPFALYGAGWCQLNTGQAEAALESFQKLIKQFPKCDTYPQALDRMGDIHLQQGEYEKAKEVFTRVAKEFPEGSRLVQALINLGWCHLNLGNFEEMTRIAHRLLKMPPSQMKRTLPQLLLGEANFHGGQYKDALPYFFNLLNVPSQRENALYKISRCYFYEGEYKDAITNVEILSLEYPDSGHLGECLYLRGQAAYHLGDTEKAVASFLEIVDKENLNPWTIAALYKLGEIYYERKDLNKARDLFTRIRQTALESETAILASYYLGLIHLQEKDYSEALKFFNDALKSRSGPVRAESHYRIGEIHLEEKTPYLALRHFETINETLSGETGWVILARFQIGAIRYARGEMAEASQALQAVLSESKDADLKEACKKLLTSIEAEKPKP